MDRDGANLAVGNKDLVGGRQVVERHVADVDVAAVFDDELPHDAFNTTTVQGGRYEGLVPDEKLVPQLRGYRHAQA